MTTEISTLGIKVDSTDVPKATGNLDDLTVSAGKTEKAVNDLNSSFFKIKQPMGQVQDSTLDLSDANEKLVDSIVQEAAAIGKTRDQILSYQVAVSDLTKSQRADAEAAIEAIKAHREAAEASRQAEVAQAKFNLTVDAGLIGIGHWTKSLLESALAASEAAELIDNKLNVALTATQGISGHTSESLEIMAVRLHDISKFDDTDIKNAQATMLTFGEVTGGTFDKALKASADLATFMGSDLVTATRMVGRALEDPTVGLMNLRRAGVAFSEVERDNIKTLMAHKDQLGAMNAILEAVEKRVGSASEAMNTGMTGAQNELSRSLNEFKETLKDDIDVVQAYEGVLKSASWVLRQMTEYQNEVNKRMKLSSEWGGKDMRPDQSPAETARFAKSAEEEAHRQNLFAQAAKEAGKAFEEATKKAQGLMQTYAETKTEEFARKQKDLAETFAVAGKSAAEYSLALAGLRKSVFGEGKDDSDAAAKAYQSLVGSVLQLTGAEKQRYELDLKIAEYEKEHGKLTEDQKIGLKNLLEFRIADTEQKKIDAQLTKEAIEFAKQEGAEHDKTMKSLQSQIEAEKNHIIELRGGKAALDAHKTALADDAIAALKRKQEAIELYGSGDDPELIMIKQEIAGWEELKKAREGVSAAQAAKDSEDAAKKVAEDWKRTADSIASSLTDALMRGFESGKDFAKNFIDVLKNWFKTLVLRPTIDFLVKGGMNAVGLGGAGADGTGLGGIGGGIGNGLLGGVGNSIGGWLTGGSSFGSWAAGGISSTFGASGFTAGLAGDAFMPAALAGTEGLAGTAGALGGAGMGAGIGALGFAGVAGIAVIAALAIKSYLDSKKGGPKTGGFATTGEFDTSGTGYTDSSGRWMTPNQSDASILKNVQGAKQLFTDLVTGFGGKAGNAQFAQGWSSDPSGSAPGNVHTGVRINGQLVYNATNANVGRSDAEMTAEITLQTKRAVLAALQASDLPKEIADYLKRTKVETATSEEIDNTLNMAQALSQVFKLFDRNILADGMDAFTQATEGAQGALKRQNTAIRDLIKNYDGSTASATALSTATLDFYNNAVAVVAQIESMKKEIDAGFKDSIRGYKMAGLDTQGQYAFYTKEIEALQRELSTTTDAQRIREIGSQINADQRAMFGLLSPEQQASMADQFVASAEKANKLVQDQLKRAQKEISDATKDLIKDVKQALLDGLAPLTTAADKQDDAADKQVKAANTPIRIIVNGVEAAPTEVGG